MSDDIDVSSGGAVAVDTASLERAAARLESVGDDLDDYARRASRMGDFLEAASSRAPDAPVELARDVASALGRATDRSRTVASSLREGARLYEIVEWTNERSLALAAGDSRRAAAADAHLALVRRADPAAAARADAAIAAWRSRWAADTAGDLVSPSLSFGPGLALGLGLLAPAAIGGAGGGVVPRGARPVGPAPAVVVTPLSASPRATTAPSSLRQMITRVPDGGGADEDARVRVERYTMPDGSQEFTAYVAGTQDWFETAPDAFDMVSNIQLYTGHSSASYEAVQAALVQSGAQPGDALNLVGFSQGGAVASWVAQDPTYDVQALVTAGSPVAVDLPPAVLSVALEHHDDLVAALQGPGHAGIQGSPDSVVVTRTADDASGLHDMLVPAHRQEAYAETAGLFEESGDPRVAAVTALLGRLSTAEDVDVTEYSAVTP